MQGEIYNSYMGTDLRLVERKFRRVAPETNIAELQDILKILLGNGNTNTSNTTLAALNTFCPGITLSKIRSFNNLRLNQINQTREGFEIAVNDLCPGIYSDEAEYRRNEQIIKLLKRSESSKLNLKTFAEIFVGAVAIVTFWYTTVLLKSDSNVVLKMIGGLTGVLMTLAGFELELISLLGGSEILVEDILRNDYKGINGSSKVFDVAAYKLAEMLPISEENKEMVAIFTTANEIAEIGFASKLIVSGGAFLIKSPKLIKSIKSPELIRSLKSLLLILPMAVATCYLCFGHLSQLVSPFKRNIRI
jgi:hypothetical protein